MPSDYYSLLGLADTASSEEIRKAFRARAREWHSDHLGPNATDAQRSLTDEKLKEINEAYGVLSDTELRRRYDAERRSAAAAGKHAGAPSARATPAAGGVRSEPAPRHQPPRPDGAGVPWAPRPETREVSLGQLVGSAILVSLWYFVFAEGTSGFQGWWNPVAIFPMVLWLAYGLRPFLRNRREVADPKAGAEVTKEP